MTIVTEYLDVFPFTGPATELRRNEKQLLAPALPGRFGRLWTEPELIETIHFDQDWIEQPFAPPRYLYEGSHGRIEWQQMNNRQPIYHRNLDVDEMSYQIAGERTLMTEWGTAELRPGDLVRIPAGVCHDNWGRRESHLLWYLPEPCADMLPPDRSSEAIMPPFAGWQPAIVNEVLTDCLGSGAHDTAAHRSDEQFILEAAFCHDQRLGVFTPPRSPSPGPAMPRWIWQGPTAWVGVVDTAVADGTRYTRHRNADEIQYQVAGTRLLVTQHGTIELRPGDFARIPIGVAFTSVAGQPSRHMTTISYQRLPRVYPASGRSDIWTAEQVAQYRAEQVCALS